MINLLITNAKHVWPAKREVFVKQNETKKEYYDITIECFVERDALPMGDGSNQIKTKKNSFCFDSKSHQNKGNCKQNH